MKIPVAIMSGLQLLLAVFGVAGCGGNHPEGVPDALRPLRVASASDLAFAFEDLKVLHFEQHSREVDIILGSTGLLARQIQQGAPFDIFFAANISFVDDLIAAGAGRADTKDIYALGRIVIWSRKDRKGVTPTQLADLLSPEIGAIAIANPDHAPYGLAAKQALIASGLWEKLEPRIVYGENVNQAFQFARSGNADIGIIALSLGIAAEGGDWTLVDEDLHEPIVQAMVVTQISDDPDGAIAFLQTVQSVPGRAIMRKYGFLLPGEFRLPEPE